VPCMEAIPSKQNKNWVTVRALSRTSRSQWIG
jgi:hypothetical protein